MCLCCFELSVAQSQIKICSHFTFGTEMRIQLFSRYNCLMISEPFSAFIIVGAVDCLDTIIGILWRKTFKMRMVQNRIFGIYAIYIDSIISNTLTLLSVTLNLSIPELVRLYCMSLFLVSIDRQCFCFIDWILTNLCCISKRSNSEWLIFQTK